MKSKNAGVKRTYYLIGTHEGQVFTAGSGTETTISCESSLFSTYMLAYSEPDKSAENPAAAFAAVIVLIVKRKKDRKKR